MRIFNDVDYHIIHDISDIVDAITPYSVLRIRNLLNTSAMDILYYTSPLYGGEVRAGLQKELNRLYSMFASRHPEWKGKVSILAHSLGCVIVYDIVTGWMGDAQFPVLTPPVQGLQFSVSHCIIFYFFTGSLYCHIKAKEYIILYLTCRLRIFFVWVLHCQYFWHCERVHRPIC